MIHSVMAVLGAAAASANPAVPADNKWHQWTCDLRQEVDAGGAYIWLSRVPGNDQTSVMLGDRVAQSKVRRIDQATITLEPEGNFVAEGFVGPGEGRENRAIHLTVRDQGFLDKFARASALIVHSPAVGTLRVPTARTSDAVTAIRKCEDEKMRGWGIDPVAWRALSARPMPKTPPAKWISWLDYPDRQKIYKNDIDVVARLDIDAQGSVKNCTVVNRPPSEYREAACQALRRNARLQPARDALGRATQAPFVIQIRFGAIHL